MVESRDLNGKLLLYNEVLADGSVGESRGSIFESEGEDWPMRGSRSGRPSDAGTASLVSTLVNSEDEARGLSGEV